MTGFTRLLHADWSANRPGRWTAEAVYVGGRWQAGAPFNVPLLSRFVDDLFTRSKGGSTLAGFDFPIGLPLRYGKQTGFCDFRTALRAFGAGEWADFFKVAETADQIAIRRPFYPQRAGPRGTVCRRHLLDGHRVQTIADLARRCEHKPATGGRAASAMFWTLGAAAVGKAAIHGWQDAIVPALHRKARLWPFDGDLAQLSTPTGVTLAETYPGDAYGQIGLSMKGRSKTHRPDRQFLGNELADWAARHRVDLMDELISAIRAGFGPEHGNDNGFDAVVGLFGMIAVVDGHRSDGAPMDDDIRRWEGWILGRGL